MSMQEQMKEFEEKKSSITFTFEKFDETSHTMKTSFKGVSGSMIMGALTELIEHVSKGAKVPNEAVFALAMMHIKSQGKKDA